MNNPFQTELAFESLISRIEDEIERNDRRAASCLRMSEDTRTTEEYSRLQGKSSAFASVADDYRVILKDFGRSNV